MQEGMFLGYKVSTNGLRACPDKADAALSLPSLRCIKDVQKLNGKLASLNRFLSKSAEKSLPFFKTLKNCTKKSDFQWTPEAEEAFKQMKKLIAELPTLTAPRGCGEVNHILAEKRKSYYLAQCKQTIEKILPSTHGRCNNKSTDKATVVKFRNIWKNAEVEVRAEGIRLSNTDKDRIKGQNISGFYCGTTEERSSGRTYGRTEIRECNDCQIHRPVPRNPQQNLTPIMSPWPFYKWGIDIAGPFPEGPGKVKFLIVAIDYFTKWIEAKAVATITGNQVKKFVWDNIVCRFGLPGEIISDNGKQFRDNPFKDWCEKLCIRQCFASVKHPQANGLVERANRSLGEGIKARLDERSRDWIEELPHVLWAHRTMIKSSNGETPFSLTYGTEAVIPAEIGMPTLRTAEIDQAKNNEALGINLDLIEERREQAAIQEAKSKKKMEKYYNSRVRGTSFKPGDMVYRSNEASHAQDGGKLGPKWEGPYEVKESLGKGAYKLKDRKGNDMPRTWNICNLKKCYIHEM
ncbi:reverse transcriptase domain-containing protein [Tanacetum coccineum]